MEPIGEADARNWDDRRDSRSVRPERRAQIILAAAELNVGRIQIGRWRERYAAGRLAVIQHDLPRSGRKLVVDAAGIVRLTTQTTPKAATH